MANSIWDEIRAYPKVFPKPLKPPHSIWVIAHRGSSKEAPENTLPAMELAIEQGADMIEFDVCVSKDGELVVHHDRTLRRTTNGRGRVSQKTLAELKALDAGSWFDPRFEGVQIPTLREVLEVTAGKIMLNVEIKKEAVHSALQDFEEKLLDLLDEFDMIEHTMVSSFNTLTLIRVKEINPKVSTALLYGNTVRTNLRPKVPIYGYQAYKLVLRTRADSLNVRRNLVTRGFLRRSRETGVRIHTFTVDQPKTMKRLIHRQVHGIITNCPTRLQNWLHKQHAKGKGPRFFKKKT